MKMGLISMLISLILVSLIFVVNYFRDFPFYLQGLLIAAVTLILYVVTAWLHFKKSDYFHLTLGISSLALLFATLWLGIGFELVPFALLLSLVAVLFIWLLSGIYFHADYLIMITTVGLLLVYGWYIHPWIEVVDSIWFQYGVWYPVAIINLLIGLFLLKKAILLGRIFFFTGLVAFFSAELHSFFLEKVVLSEQLLLFVLHVILVTIILHATRRLWFN